MNESRPLHRLFGLSWIDFFQDTPVDVETELDLSIKQQFLDVVLIRTRPGPILRRLPDGFDDLASHNLMTFKSHQEALDCWALWELIGHFVNYRKQSSPSMQDLFPESDYRLFAVCARYPQGLAQHTDLVELQPGVYNVCGLGLSIRIVVVSHLPQQEHNAMLHLFSARDDLLRFGREHYRPRSNDTSTVIFELLRTRLEEMNMADKRIEEFARQSIEGLWNRLSPEERRKYFPIEERLKDLPPEEIRKHLPVNERLKGLTADEILEGLPAETKEALARQLKANE